MTEPERPVQLARAAAPLRTAVHNLMLEEFDKGAFVPGQRLLENELCLRYGVSRTTIREVLRGLEAEGLVEMIPQKGPVVRAITPNDATSIYELRGALEGLAASLFVKRSTEEQRTELHTITQQLQQAASSNEIPAYIECKHRFYNLLLDGAGNPELTRAVRSVQARVTSLMRLSLLVPWRMKASAQEIEQFTSRALELDEEGASKAMLEHVVEAGRAAMVSLESAAK